MLDSNKTSILTPKSCQENSFIQNPKTRLETQIFEHRALVSRASESSNYLTSMRKPYLPNCASDVRFMYDLYSPERFLLALASQQGLIFQLCKKVE